MTKSKRELMWECMGAIRGKVCEINQRTNVQKYIWGFPLLKQGEGKDWLLNEERKTKTKEKRRIIMFMGETGLG